jgi:hypothetical protein
MTHDPYDQAFLSWAMRRHTWLWRMGFGSRRLKSRRAAAVARSSAVALMRLDRLLWTTFVPR